MKEIIAYGRHHFYDILDKNSIIFDLGGNTGSVTTYLKDMYDCIIHLYEANPTLIPTLKDNLSKYNNIFIHNVAIDDKIGEMEFYVDGLADTLSSCFLHNTMTNPVTIKVHTTTIEKEIDYLDIDELDLIKMDIEGVEYRVILGMNKNILSRIKQLQIEYHNYNGLTNYMQEVHTKLKECGFKHYVFDNLKDHLYIRKDLL